MFYMIICKHHILFFSSCRDSGSIALSPWPAIFLKIGEVFIIYVLFKMKLYLLLLHCLFESFVNMYLLSLSIITLFLNVWYCSKLTVHTNVEMSHVCYRASLVKCICKFTAHQWVPLKLWNGCLFDRQFLMKPPYFLQMMY